MPPGRHRDFVATLSRLHFVNAVDVAGRLSGQPSRHDRGRGVSGPGKIVVLFAGEIIDGGASCFARLVKAARGSQLSFNGRVVVNVFAIVDGVLFYFPDCRIDFIDGALRLMIDLFTGCVGAGRRA